jgi:hypothetical protein
VSINRPFSRQSCRMRIRHTLQHGLRQGLEGVSERQRRHRRPGRLAARVSRDAEAIPAVGVLDQRATYVSKYRIDASRDLCTSLIYGVGIRHASLTIRRDSRAVRRVSCARAFCTINYSGSISLQTSQMPEKQIPFLLAKAIYS